MPDNPDNQAQPSSSRQDGQASRGNRRGRGGRNRGRGGAAAGKDRKPSSQPSQQPSQQPEQPQQSQSQSTPSQPAPAESSAESSRSNRGGRGRRSHQNSNRGGARGGARPPRPRTAGGRAFGGHLTAPAGEDASSPNPNLSGDAPEFVPGQPLAVRSTPEAKPHVHTRPKLPKSTAEDLGTRIHEDIDHINYECAICTDDVLRTSSIWSCNICWTVVHLRCVKRWYMKTPQPSEPQAEMTWRCPGCNSKLTEEPGSYHCWCGKDINPSPASKALPPHSCGQTCSKPRGTCPHPCSLQCHAGPCPPCDLTGPIQSCFCGKNTSQKLCRETDYENGWSCQEPCEDLMPCGEHLCEKLCHSGLCGDCTVVVDAKCYCGRVEKQVPCFEREDPEQSFSTKDNEWFEASLNCGGVCERNFDCGHHKCSQTCHPQDEQPAHCPFSPDMVTYCPCGKTALDELLENPRESCQDAIPHCDKPCEKLLPCGHLCKAKCHVGECGFCYEMIDILCRCGRTSTTSVCHQGDLQHPLCMRTCQANLSCGRHKCGEHCCPGEKKAAERSKRKNRSAEQAVPIEAEHICIKTCGRPLKCGSHNCQQMCHRGPCGSCPEAIFHEISCDCGRTVLQPPQPCGTRPPECRFDCQRRPSCGHPAVSHNCHSDDIACPKCPFLVDKWCACGKEKLHSQPCHLQEPRCGRPCGKTLKCGLHKCKKLCHRDADCEDAATSSGHCSQICGKTKLFCDHPCQKGCHGQTPCNESTACTGKVTISCPCGLRKQEVKCLASSSNPTPSHPEIKCDDECLRLDRNRRLAAALNIDPSAHVNDHVPYSDETLSFFQDNQAWAETQEREFRVFASTPSEVRLRYKPMPSHQREFLHLLAKDFGLESRSEEPEPQRYVVVYKGPRFVSAPSKTLAQCVKIRAKQAAEAAAAAEASRPPSPPGIVLDPYNSYLLVSPRFGLTAEEITAALQTDLSSQPSIRFKIDFLPATDEVLIRATTNYSSFLTPSALEQALATLKSRLAITVSKNKLAGAILLCHVDDNNEISRKENLAQNSTSGWSAVAGRAASRKSSPMSEDGAAKAPGRKLLGLKKKKVEKEKESTWSALSGDVEC